MREYADVVKTLVPVIGSGQSLEFDDASPLAREIAYGVLRDYYYLTAVVDRLVSKPLGEKNLDLQVLLLAGMYSANRLKRPTYTSVNAVVEAAVEIGKPWAKALLNGVLRNYLRNRESIDADVLKSEEARTNHPDWMITALRDAWGDQAEAIMDANNRHAPMTLRINQRRTSVADYQSLLDAAGLGATPGELALSALYLAEPVATASLPGFNQGLCSVQDEASQLAAGLMNLFPGARVLDACAAPGGKTCHMLEILDNLDLTALDINQRRCRQIEQNLERLGQSCTVVVADLLNWRCEPESIDRILLDVPCSATGIIRRHPDIKLLRRQTDIAKLASAQVELLSRSWQLLKKGGELVYSTCSILPAENAEVVARFLALTPDACTLPIDASWGQPAGDGRQLLPTQDRHDGFFYARLSRKA